MSRIKIKNRGAHILFWSWNVIFLAFMMLGFAPQILPEMITAVQGDAIPVIFLVYAFILTMIPALVLALGFGFFRTEPSKLFTLGYGIEGPLMLMLAIRFFAVRQATPAITALLVIAGVGMLTLLWQLLDKGIDERHAVWSHVRVIGLTLLLATGLYVSVWLGFYVLPVATVIWSEVGNILSGFGHFWQDFWVNLQSNWRMVPFAVLGFILLVYTGSLFVLMPIAVPILYVRTWWRSLRVLASRYSQPRAAMVTTAVLVVAVLVVVQGNRQPQHKAFALLEEPPQTVAEAEALLAEEAAIRDGLLNAYLAPQRYFGAEGNVHHIQDVYEWEVGLSPERAAKVQDWYDVVASPTLYQPATEVEVDPENRWRNPVFEAETVEAAELYQQFFDESIIAGERGTVVNAMRSTWSIDQAQANWQAVDDREIYLAEQVVTVTEQGDWAEIELYEVYENQTLQRQEVVYYFSLPESAVITGVWLGHSGDRDERFSYRVAPRGAAQAVYRNEVRRNMDPALVEQIGPRQYRLRVFPIEPQTWQWDETLERSKIGAAPPMHMWLTWQVLATENHWPLPKMAEKRNVYWDEASVRLLNGEVMVVDEEAWLPETVMAQTAVMPQTHRFDFGNGQTVIAQPVHEGDLPQLTGKQHVAVVLDRSRSMAAYETAVIEALTQLDQLDPMADLYLTASPFRGEGASRMPLAELDAENILYFGGQNAGELLVQYESLRQADRYDAVIVLTDGSGYELGDQALTLPLFEAPIWLVHLNGDYSLGYDDATLAAIQASGGGVAATVDEALTRLLVTQEGRWADASPDIIDGYLWRTVATSALESETAVVGDNGFAAMAARRLILAEMMAQQERLDVLDVLDGLHALAIENSIVTPYSSMIVLVTPRQEQLLDELEGQADRFDREFEAVADTEPETAITVTGVPEPEEWLLMGLSLALLGWYWYSNRRQAAYGVGNGLT